MGKRLNITDEERLQRRRAHQREYNKERNSPVVLIRQSEKEERMRLDAGAEPQPQVNKAKRGKYNKMCHEKMKERRSIINKRYRDKQKILERYKRMYGENLINDLKHHNHLELKEINGELKPHLTPLGQSLVSAAAAATVMFPPFNPNYQYHQHHGMIYQPYYHHMHHHQNVIGVDYGTYYPQYHAPSVPSRIIDDLYTELSIPLEPSDSILPVAFDEGTNISDILDLPEIKDDYCYHDNIEKVGMYSTLVRGFGQKRPPVMEAMKSIVCEMYNNEFNTPDGCWVSIDAPFSENANMPTPNVECRKVLRNYWGRLLEDGYTACYATATGAYTVGITPK